MIDAKTKIHDRFSIEFKMSFLTRRKLRKNKFSVYMWIFMPNSLDINRATYPKAQFYKDVKSYIRLLTPKFLMREIAGGEALPLKSLKRIFEQVSRTPTRTLISEYEYQIKMFSAIVKSSFRDESNYLISQDQVRSEEGTHKDDVNYLCSQYVSNAKTILASYRDLWKIVNVPSVPQVVRDTFFYADDFISSVARRRTLDVLQYIESHSDIVSSETHQALRTFITEEMKYRHGAGYGNITKGDDDGNRNLVFRHGILKKYIESDLFLEVPKKRDGVVAEQLMYSIAAGLAMIFATVVSFFFQKTYGNFTVPLFIALVVSYMLKDRIKDLMRYYFAHRIGSRYFDNKADISTKGHKIGWLKEGVDFIPDSQVPQRVREIRYGNNQYKLENRIADEKVLLYRKSVLIDRKRMSKDNDYEVKGINDIIRLQVNSFLHKMDNPDISMLNMGEDGKLENVTCNKVYYMNIVLQTMSEYKRFRIALTRNGIDSIEEIFY